MRDHAFDVICPETAYTLSLHQGKKKKKKGSRRRIRGMNRNRCVKNVLSGDLQEVSLNKQTKNDRAREVFHAPSLRQKKKKK